MTSRRAAAGPATALGRLLLQIAAVALPLWVATAPGAATWWLDQQNLSFQSRQRAVRELARGKLLLAARNLPDPNFAETLVLLADFSPEAAMGLIVNRPTDYPLAQLLPHADERRTRGMTLFFGGPVAERGVLGLLRSAAAGRAPRHVVKDVYLINTREGFDEALASGAGAERFRVYVGYAGWGAGQLERETAQGSWHVLDGEGEIVFDPDPESLWQRQIRRVEGRSARKPGGEADAPAFPTDMPRKGGFVRAGRS